jgi:hypothetical protein
MNKRFIISESEKNEIRKMYGLINEENDVISQYVSDPRLQNLLRGIQSEFGEYFTKEHFDYEIGVSGQIKTESGGLIQSAVQAFNKMKDESGCPDIFIKEKDTNDQTLSVSYRTYEDQKKRFINEGSNAPQGQKINTAMKRVSIPGYSQHHTGLAIDYGGNTICLREKAWPNGDFNKVNKWGFTLPYMSGNIRMKEPWHLQYVGVGTSNQNQSGNQTNQSNKISISAIDLSGFTDQIASKTYGQSLNLDNIEIDVDKKTFSIDRGDTKVFKLVLRYNMNGEKTCQSCENTITRNQEYSATAIKKGNFENNNRIYSLIVLYPLKQ